MTHNKTQYRPKITSSESPQSSQVTVYDEYRQPRIVHVTAERPLTIIVDRLEIVTLMTLGRHPELLIIGYLLNQCLVKSVNSLISVEINWDKNTAEVATRHGITGINQKIFSPFVKSGCSQGTLYHQLPLHNLSKFCVPSVTIKQSKIYELLRCISDNNTIYKQSGSVHSCGICCGSKAQFFVEDVGRHNAVDIITGYMALERISGADKIFYTTGRLTAEMVIKVLKTGVPVVVSRNGVTEMGLDLARNTDLILIARAKGKHFIVYNGHTKIIYDQLPIPKEIDQDI